MTPSRRTPIYDLAHALARALAIGLASLLLANAVLAQEAVIRKNISERMPDFPKIDEVNKSSMAGLYEVRVGAEIFYTDEQGNHLIDGQLIDTRTRVNLTEARLNKINAIDFAALPLKDALVWKVGSGARKIVVFADPNCGYCKRFERELQKAKDMTVYTFLLPILGGDSPEKSRSIWCAKDSTAAWRNWMLDSVAPPRVMGECDSSAVERNTALARKHRVNGTPAIIFEDGKRVPGAMSLEQLEKQLVASRSTK
jgi:thiol:disulfide interchange protein DsbC